jgi:hypothetical protein
LTDWSGEELRRDALAALGVHADGRVREALAHARVSRVGGAAHWAGSAGPVEAHRVEMGLDARTLGGLRAAPAVADALCAAFAAAVAAQPGQVLLDLALRWDPQAGAPVGPEGYRDAQPPAPPPSSLRDALVSYLEATGEPALARSLDGVVLEETTSPREITLRGDRATRDALRADARAVAILTRALRDLLGDVRARVQLR